MTELPVTSDRLADLAELICDEIASKDDLIELDSLMLADEALCCRYVDYCRVHGALRLESRAHRAAQKACKQLNNDPIATISDDSHSAEAVGPSFAPIFLSTTLHSAVGYLSSGWPVAYLAATVIFGIGLVIGTITQVSHPEYCADTSAPATELGDSPTATMQSVGRITGMVDCKWDGMAPGSPGVVLGRKYELASGLMEITYDTGAKVILQGPTTYAVESRNGGFLSIGKLTGKVEVEKAKGFAVRTPTATVTDLGTEFGVEVNKAGQTTTHVFRGKVKLLALDAGGDRVGHELAIGENESVRVERTQGGVGWQPVIVRIREPKSSEFVRDLSLPKQVQASKAYADIVLSLQPVVYYRMERSKDEKDRNVIIDSAPAGHHGVLHYSNEFADGSYVHGRFGQALRFRGPMTSDYAIVPDYPKAANGRLSVSVWIMAMGRSELPTIVANWACPRPPEWSGKGQFIVYLPNGDSDLSACATQRDGRRAEVREGPEHALPLGVWQHVALVLDGAAMHLYRNGQEVASSPCVGVLLEPPKYLTVGCKSEPADADTPSHWQGLIDELAIFDRALSAEQIRQLFLGKSTVATNSSDTTLGRSE